MKLTYATIVGLAALVFGLWPAHAENRPQANATPTSTEQCQSEIQKFEKVIGFIRDAQGVQAAAEVKEKMLPSKTAAEIMNREGACGLAKYMREKKLVS